MARQNISTGTNWEEMAGYSRAVRVGNIVHIAGTTATDDTGNIVGYGDAGQQTEFILQKIEKALIASGASLQHVVRTRIFLTDMTQWEAAAKVHGRVFASIRPVNTLVGISALVGEGYVVEIEAEAIIET